MAIFISIDGIDGAGKSTQIKRLAEWLRSMERNVETTQEPGGTPVGQAIRTILLSKSSQLMPETEMLLFSADRAEHQYKIRDLLEKGSDVICDRFLPSTWAYQIFGRKLEPELLEALISRTVTTFPDLTIIMDMDVSAALQRSIARLKAVGREINEGRFEAENENFYREVKQGFRWYASQERFGRSILIDSNGTENEVFAQIKKEVEEILKAK